MNLLVPSEDVKPAAWGGTAELVVGCWPLPYDEKASAGAGGEMELAAGDKETLVFAIGGNHVGNKTDWVLTVADYDVGLEIVFVGDDGRPRVLEEYSNAGRLGAVLITLPTLAPVAKAVAIPPAATALAPPKAPSSVQHL